LRADQVGTFTAANGGEGPVVLNAVNVHKFYGSNVHALDGVSLTVRKGEVVGFLGPNGAGKTTFTKCVLGLVTPSSGSIHLFGQTVQASNRSALDRVGVVPDQYDFYPSLTATQVLAYYGRLYGIAKSELPGRIEETLRTVGMLDLARKKVREYSHGMKQRLCIAQAIMHRPEFIIFDEPTNGLDPRGAFEVRELIKGLSAQGVTIFLSSHIMSEVEAVCSRVAILSRGRVLVQSTVEGLREKLRAGKQRVFIIQLENPDPRFEGVAVSRGYALRSTLAGDALRLELAPDMDVGAVVTALVSAGAKIRGVNEETVGLEQIFLEITKGEGGR
jgi:ABC-type multidrug transport system ATPase subunit